MLSSSVATGDILDCSQSLSKQAIYSNNSLVLLFLHSKCHGSLNSQDYIFNSTVISRGRIPNFWVNGRLYHFVTNKLKGVYVCVCIKFKKSDSYMNSVTRNYLEATSWPQCFWPHNTLLIQVLELMCLKLPKARRDPFKKRSCGAICTLLAV